MRVRGGRFGKKILGRREAAVAPAAGATLCAAQRKPINTPPTRYRRMNEPHLILLLLLAAAAATTSLRCCCCIPVVSTSFRACVLYCIREFL